MRTALVAFAVTLTACSDPLVTTTLPDTYAPGLLLVLAGSTGSDDIWVREETSAQGVPLFHFDGTAWTALPVEPLAEAAGNPRPLITATSSATSGELLVCTDNASPVFRMDTTGAVVDVSAGLPLGTHAMNKLGSPTFASTTTAATDTDPEQYAMHRRDSDAWTALPSPPGPVFAIELLDDGVFISGNLPFLVSNQVTVEYFATLDGDAWNVIELTDARLPPLLGFGPRVVRAGADVWGITEAGAVRRSESSGGDNFGVPWVLAHFDGAAWPTTSIDWPTSYTSNKVVTWGGLGIVEGEGDGLQMILNRVESGGVDADAVQSLAVARWDGAALSEPTSLARYAECYACSVSTEARFLGQLADDQVVFHVPATSTMLVGALP